MLAGFVALLIVPIQTAEELETGTFGALRLAATGPEILTAKVLGGLVYGLAGTSIIVGITQPGVPRPVLFAVASVLLVLSMVGFGMVLGLVTRNANAINSYGGFLVFPLVGLAGAVMFVTSGIFTTVLDFLPFKPGDEAPGQRAGPGGALRDLRGAVAGHRGLGGPRVRGAGALREPARGLSRRSPMAYPCGYA